MQDFKKLGKRIGRNILFIVILVGLFVGVSKILETTATKNDIYVPIRNKSMFRILKEPNDTIDVVVLGDSLSYTSVSPMELWEQQGITSYICGQPGQRIQETYYLLERVFETQSPKLIILETNVMFRGKPGLAGVKDSLAKLGNHYVPLFRHHDMWKSFVMDKKYPEENYKGFAFRSKKRSYKRGEYMLKTKQREQMPDIVLIYMNKIMDLCNENNAKLLLVSSPSPSNYNYRRHNSLEKYAKENSLAYLDMNLLVNKIGIDWKNDTVDRGDHLNLFGAQKVTRYLGEYLKEQYKLPDHRSDHAYDSWRKELHNYNRKASKYGKVTKK